MSEDDQAFVAERDRVARLEQELAVASQKAEKVLLQEEKYGDAMGELGLECVKLAKLEDGEAVRRGGGAYGEEAQIGRDTALRARKMGNAAVRVSRLTRAAVGALSKSLQPMHEYLSMMPAVRRAVADRGDALLEWRRGAAEVEAKKARLARLETDITNMLKVDLLKREVAEASVAAERARGEYETVKARHADEFSRLEKSRCASFKRMWLAFARTQAAHAERAVQVWRAVAEDLGASPEEWRGTERADAGGGEGPSSAAGGPREVCHRYSDGYRYCVDVDQAGLTYELDGDGRAVPLPVPPAGGGREGRVGGVSRTARDGRWSPGQIAETLAGRAAAQPHGRVGSTLGGGARPKLV